MHQDGWFQRVPQHTSLLNGTTLQTKKSKLQAISCTWTMEMMVNLLQFILESINLVSVNIQSTASQSSKPTASNLQLSTSMEQVRTLLKLLSKLVLRLKSWTRPRKFQVLKQLLPWAGENPLFLTLALFEALSSGETTELEDLSLQKLTLLWTTTQQF